TLYPGDFLGVTIVAWDVASGQSETLYHSTTSEVFPVAATDSALYWGEHLRDAPCGRLWRRANGADSDELVASGDEAPRERLSASPMRAYWMAASGLRYDE